MEIKCNCIECLYYNFIDRKCKAKQKPNTGNYCKRFFKLPNEDIKRRKEYLDKIIEKALNEKQEKDKSSNKITLSLLYFIPVLIFALYISITMISDPSATFYDTVLNKMNIFLASYIIIFVVHLMLYSKL